ncbi:hypothetical protein V4V48_004177 [Vibrio mimicus]|nr:hypothetical protein [Vibrio vulnificus]EJL6392656.1 hypothetical protein [Vibrio vulnificus]ELV8614164.1 hypothetical protein [Vibrio vulnificus]
MRTYKEQFESETVAQIEEIIGKLESISYPTGPSRYYGLDLVMCLKSGALAGSMVVASALMELFVRGLIVRYTENAQNGWSNKVEAEIELESMRRLNFKEMLKHLTKVKLFDEQDADNAIKLYETVRIPMHHGLPSRLLGRDKEGPFDSFRTLLGLESTVSMNDFERHIEYEGLSTINEIVSIIKNNQYVLNDTYA